MPMIRGKGSTAASQRQLRSSVVGLDWTGLDAIYLMTVVYFNQVGTRWAQSGPMIDRSKKMIRAAVRKLQLIQFEMLIQRLAEFYL